MVLVPLAGKKGSSRDLIVSILSKQWPLSVKEIQVELERLSGERFSYQAVHKMLSQLESEGIVVFENRKFALDLDWVLNLKKFSLDLEAELSRSGAKKVPKKFGAQTELHFDNFSVFCVSMTKIFIQMGKIMEPKGAAIAFIRGAWFPLSFSFTDFSLLHKMAEVQSGKIFVLIGENLPFDRWVKERYEEAGFSVHIDPTATFEKDFGASGSYYYEVEFSKETRKMLENLYSKLNNLVDLFSLYSKHLMKKQPKMDITVRIFRNPQLARFAYEKIAEYFPNKKEVRAASPFKLL
ncbi:MAG: hypothetical protein V1777_03990 [Candidatus Micrarchaeota archaeon]